MGIGIWFSIIVLVAAIIGLIIYNAGLKKKLIELNNTSQKVTSLSVLQDFINTIGDGISADEKIKKINEILIERYEIKYSTIVVYDGAEYKIKASNVEEKHWETLRNLQTEPVFTDSIQTATPKYITINNENERLPYLKMEFARAKAAMFFPLYIDNIYIGYWIIEGSKSHEFDNVDTTVLEVVKNNIVAVLKTIENQKVIENIVRKDTVSGLKSAEFLYGQARKTIDKYPTSAVCLFNITNLTKINNIVSRKTGDAVISKVTKIVTENLSAEYFVVRYSGPKFAIVFSGSDISGVEIFMEDIKTKIEASRIKPKEDYNPKNKKRIVVTPKINAVITTYYKGTGIEQVIKKLEEYLDTTDQKENKITCL